MKKLTLSVSLFIITSIAFSQTVTWSPDVVKPKNTDKYTYTSFPGVNGDNYFVDEGDAGGFGIAGVSQRKWRDYILTVDKNTMKVKHEEDLRKDFGSNYLNGPDFFLNGRKYYFFVDRDNDDKDIYPVYCVAQGINESAAGELKKIQQVDRSKDKPFKDVQRSGLVKPTKEDAARSAISYVNIKPSYDQKTLVSAFVYETVDDNYSMLNISEWDADMKPVFSNNYKIPFVRRATPTKTIFGNIAGGQGDKPYIFDVRKDNNGFVYVLVKTPDIKNEEEGSSYWIYQFKLSDPAYFRTLHKEFNKNLHSTGMRFFQDESGKLFIANPGSENDGDKIHYGLTNSAVIGTFDAAGNFSVIFSGRLKDDMMYNFDSEKKVDKNEGVYDLDIDNVLMASDGGCYVIWQKNWVEEHPTTEFDKTPHASTAHYENLFVQCFSGSNKLLWGKPIFKDQTTRERMGYVGFTAIVVGNLLYMIWPDDPNNEKRAVDDKDVSKFSVVKFGNKDLAGMFVAQFNPKGDYTRKYIHWPEDRLGYALNVRSFRKTGDNEYMGTARVIHQSAFAVTSEEYAFFKIKF